MIRYHVTLTKEEREELEGILHKGKHKASEIRNANILLSCDEGKYSEKITNEEIIRRYRVSARTIDRLKKRFVIEGYEIALKGRSRNPRRKLKIFGDVEAHIIAIACSEPPEGRAVWTLQLIADKMVELKYIESISSETVRQVLKKTSLNHGKKSDLSSPKKRVRSLFITWSKC